MTPLSSFSPTPSQPLRGDIPSPSGVVLTQVQAILAKAALEQADINEIKRLERSIYIETHRHIELVIAVLLKKAEESHLDYYEYAHQMADMLTYWRWREAMKRMIENHKHKKLP